MAKLEVFVKMFILLVCMLSLFIKPTPVLYASEVKCIQRERQALLKFKQDVIDVYNSLSSWGSREVERECCEWVGVQCSNITGHVIRLDLSYSFSRGRINPVLLELQHLEHLDLSGNPLRVNNLDWLPHLSSLRYLDLSYNDLHETENWLQQISKLSFLEELHLSGCQLPNTLPAFDIFANSSTSSLLDLHYSFSKGRVSPVLLELQHLEHLYLSGNSLRVNNLDWLPHLSSLRYLDLSNNDLHETKNWLQQISKLSFLEELHLFTCQLPDTLPAFHIFVNSSMSSLRILDLSFNNLSSFTIFSSLFNSSTHLTRVSLSYNKFNGPIHDSFGSLHFLEQLFLAGNVLNEIPLSLGNLSHLGFLLLSDNAFTQPLDQVFQNLSGKASKSLESIDLHNNQLVGSLPDITKFSSLQTLKLGSNQLSGFHPQSPGQLSSLVFLYLSHNKIGGSFPELRAFSSLQELYLSGNQIKYLPKRIGQLPKLEQLDLSSNSLEGMITEDHLSNIPSLKYLDFSHNTISFNMSFDWSPPFQLIALGLTNCNAGPDFPKWLKTQRSLESLDLSSAGISNTLPTWLWDMPSLSVLNLSHNHISGRIPHQPSNFHGILYIDLSYNHLTSSIPLSLFHSIELQLSNNAFSGSISHLCKATNDANMEVLDLSDNQFTGELLDCWKNTNSLRIVNLANNNFTGQIPSAFGNMPQLERLHLRTTYIFEELH